MARDGKKRQKKLQKKAAKRKQKKTVINRRSALMAAPRLSRAKDWPVEAAWITSDWQKPEQIIQALVVRRGPLGHLALANVLIDTMCLGVKSAYARITDDLEYDETLKFMQKNQALVPADIDLIAKIIRESVAYAGELGFRPDKDLRKAMMVLGDANPDACLVDVPLGGPEGKPYFFAGPHDNVDRIMDTLMKKLGPDGFTYTVPLNPMDAGFDFDEALAIDDGLEDEFLEDESSDTIVLDESDYKSNRSE